MVNVVAPGTGDAGSREAQRRFVDTRLLRDSDEIKALIAYGSRYFRPPNPREIKRFVNLYRFLMMIHTERSIAGLLTAGSVDQLAKIALVSTRWPSLLGAMATQIESGDPRTVFELLEQPPPTKAVRGDAPGAARARGLTKALVAGSLTEGTIARLVEVHLCDFMASEPIVGPTSRIYL